MSETHRDNPGECDCCGFVTDAVTLYKGMDTTIAGGGKTIQADFWYCELCASTITSTVDRYPGRYPESYTLKTICYVGNAILAAIREASKSGPAL